MVRRAGRSKAMRVSDAPIERKVTAATVGAVLAGFFLWLLRTYVFRGNIPVDSFVQDMVQILAVAAATFISGWWAKHTPRRDADTAESNTTDAA